MKDIERFISKVRDSFVGSQQVYSEGSCYHFYLIMKEVFEDAESWYDGDHIITKLNGKFYDISGEIGEPNSASKYDKAPAYWLKHPYNIYKSVQ